MPSDSGIRKVCENFKVRVHFSRYADETIVYDLNSRIVKIVPGREWESLTDEKLEDLVVSWLLGLCFGDKPGHQFTNPCAEILLPDGPKLCTL